MKGLLVAAAGVLFKRLLLLCGLSFALLAPAAAQTAARKAGPARTNVRVRRAIEGMTRAIEVFAASGNLRRAGAHVQVAETEVAALSHALPAGDPLLEALELARNSLTHAALISDAAYGRRRPTDEEAEALSVICEEYHAPVDRGGRTLFGECLKLIMREARDRQRKAFAAASGAGVYTP